LIDYPNSEQVITRDLERDANEFTHTTTSIKEGHLSVEDDASEEDAEDAEDEKDRQGGNNANAVAGLDEDGDDDEDDDDADDEDDGSVKDKGKDAGRNEDESEDEEDSSDGEGVSGAVVQASFEQGVDSTLEICLCYSIVVQMYFFLRPCYESSTNLCFFASDLQIHQMF
jgi:hypothetical protein